jgi:hypothetical protein
LPLARLLQLAPKLLTIAFSRERLLRSTLVTRFQIEGMLLDVFDDVFLLNLPLETSECALDRLALLDFHFRHALTPPQLRDPNMLGYHEQTRILGAIPAEVNEIPKLLK